MANKLQNLIQELCPDGVKFVKLGEVRNDFIQANLDAPTFTNEFGGTSIRIMRIKTKPCESNCESELTEQQQLVLDAIVKNNNIIANQIANQLRISKRTVDTCIAQLRQKGYIAKQSASTRSPWVVLKTINLVK